MSYTKEDLVAVRKAKLDLSLGKMVGQVTIMGQVIKYQETSMKALETVEKEIIKTLPSPKKIKQVTLKYDRGL